MEYEVQGNYGYGWEVITAEETEAAAYQQLKVYNSEEPQYSHRVKKVKVTA